MNRGDLVDYIADKTEVSKAKANEMLDAMMEGITEAMKSGDKVQLVGFGTFEVRSRAAREGRNPKTGQTINIAASKSVAFKCGAKLKAAV